MPKSSLRADQAVDGTPARPALVSQGDTVVAHVGAATVDVTVVGPGVPATGLIHPPATTPCTWTVTLSKASATVTLDPSSFAVKDRFGRISHPGLAAGSPAPPATVGPGGRVSFRLYEVAPTGEGLVLWSPGGATLAMWDYVAELD